MDTKNDEKSTPPASPAVLARLLSVAIEAHAAKAIEIHVGELRGFDIEVDGQRLVCLWVLAPQQHARSMAAKWPVVVK